ncbi:hypothetical protein [Phytohabitans aurantiacus]|uniref:Uncharacterized protein n=1 Tax=Phytohabitans aurantiacus TaxID=3016789 RepID=A0ABQ5QRZ9_9ACTN|nr:hypothetical protein [Phytohabitans aurantiacus]GLH97378.1 hypothetical protein Pa4123_26530 [Phytohabitans aurantiacus]
MADIVEFPGVGPAPAPGPADLDAIGDRYTALCEARERDETLTVRLLALAVAEDVPVLRDEVGRVARERDALAADIAHLRGQLASVRRDLAHEVRNVVDLMEIRPVDGCRHISPVDGLCAHPAAMTPECGPGVDCPELARLLQLGGYGDGHG